MTFEICFFHSVDFDGKASAAIAYQAGTKTLYGINYGDKFPWELVQGKRVLMVDFSLQPFSEMIKLNELCDLTWIDHHKSALLDLRDSGVQIKGIQRDGTGACALTWEYLFTERPMPLAVQMLAEYDVWNHTNPKTLPFQSGMRLKEWKPDDPDWEKLFYHNVFTSFIVADGETILKYEQVQNRIRANALCFPVELDGLHCIAANQGLTNSKLFDSVWNSDEYDAMLTFSWHKDHWSISLYTDDRPDIDVSIIAKARGGGGHKNAAGFESKTLPWENQK